MRSGKQQMNERIELPNWEKIRMLREKKNYKFLRIWEVETIKQVEMKEKIKKRGPQVNEKTTQNQAI